MVDTLTQDGESLNPLERLREQLLRLFGTTRDFRKCRAIARGLWSDPGFTDEHFAQIQDATRDIRSFRATAFHPTLRVHALAWFVAKFHHSLSLDDYDQLLESSATQEERTYLETQRTTALIRLREFEAAADHGDSILEELSDGQSATAAICRAKASNFVATAWMELGDYYKALQYVKRGMANAQRESLLEEITLRHTLGSIYWHSGQPDIGLRIHMHSETRAKARTLKKKWSLQLSHLAAAKCAIDCGRFIRAEAELREARPIVRRNYPRQRARLWLYEAELSWRRDQKAKEALRGAKSALDLFRSSGHKAGELEAHLLISEIVMRQMGPEPSLISDIHLEKLRLLSSDHGRTEARDRVLVLLSESIGRQSDPVDILELRSSVSEMTNPARRIQALGSLHLHAARMGEEQIRGEIQQEIHSLKDRLPRGTYVRLYRAHVQEKHESMLRKKSHLQIT